MGNEIRKILTRGLSGGPKGARGFYVFILLLTDSARAEVLDKELLPWSAQRLIATVLVIVFVGLGVFGAASVRKASTSLVLRVLVGVIAVGWALLNALDDFFDPVVGRAMRVELGEAGSLAYVIVLICQLVLPVAAALFGFRWSRSRRRASEAP
jgi:hypothetical protein